MNYLVIDSNSVFVAKENLEIIKSRILEIEKQKPMLSFNETIGPRDYCQKVIGLLEDCFASGFTKIEEWKRVLKSELSKGAANNFKAVCKASDILIQLQFSLTNAYPYDKLPQCNIALSLGRDTIIGEVGKATNNSTMRIVGQALSLAFKVVDMSKAGQMYWFYNMIIVKIGDEPQYENERKILDWAKVQRAYAFIAMGTTMIGGVASIAEIIDEATAKRDIEEYRRLHEIETH